MFLPWEVWPLPEGWECNDGYQIVKMLLYKNCLEWHRFIMHLVTVPNYNENLSLSIFYNTHGYNITYNELLYMLITLEYNIYGAMA